ncbi:SusC/RagA family TonB-linked outer membrane protein [Larkinella punicea]|uniref:TonB-dependent receptor n=1 Tax=Larkinella punicea TaxID=2315727 RepID=A0A368JIY6_9BACT|nr:TonB-dependent receptor [Larkinella punicea]RCR67502.1 TonB-dependent receptor [Larkinella punicea]
MDRQPNEEAPNGFLAAVKLMQLPQLTRPGNIIPQDQEVSGTVTDEKGETLPGVSVLVKGSQQGTTTDADGKYKLRVSNREAVLVFSFVGYVSKEVVVSNQTQLNASLQADTKALEEVVVVGYGTQKKTNLTGAVSTIDSKAIENRPVSNLANAMQGTTPGLAITRTGGQPGNENIAIQVRGATSANGNVNPLLLVDGVAAPILTLQTINPNDVESISVLKDAAAAAIYGAQAAGGVILVTTKKGVAGKTTFDYSNQIGFDWALNVPERLSLMEEAQFANLARANSGAGPEYTDEDLQRIRDRVEYVVNPVDTNRYIFYNQKDLVKQMIRDRSYMQTHNLSARGGTDKLSFLASLGYYHKQGVFKVGPDQLQRYNARLNLTAQLTRKLSFDSRIAYTLEKQKAPVSATDGNALLYQVYRLRTRWPLLTPEGRLNGEGGSSGNNTYAQLTAGGYNNRDRNYFDGVFTFRLAEVVKGLQLRAIYGVQYRLEDRERFARTIELWNRVRPSFYLNNPNVFEVTRGTRLNNNIQLLADYNTRIGTNHTIQALVGYQWEDGRFSSVFSSANNLASNDLPSLNLGNDLTKVNTQTIETFAYQSYFGRINYNFADKYLFEATLRVDESSRLAPGNRRKAFPAASVGWNLHRENWFSSVLPLFSEFKLRGSWGQLGSALGNNIGLYDYLNLLDRGSALILGTPEVRSTYFYQGSVPSSSLTWETVETANGGVDLGFLQNRLQLTVDYYVKFNRNMLTPLQLPATFGVSTPLVNNGELKSWGWETELRYRDKIGKDVNYSVAFNLSDNQNQLLSYAGRKVISAGTVSILEGYPINSLWGYKTDGYFSSATQVQEWAFQDNRTGTGDVKYRDLNGDNRITPGNGTPENPGDLVYLGTNQPRFLFGFNGSVQWKGLDFSFFFQGVGKRSFFPAIATVMPLNQGWIQALAIHRNYWTETNADAAFPRPYLQGTHNYLRADKWMLNGQYMRLKNIQIGYSLPVQAISKIGLSRARLFVTGQDILTFSRLGVFKQLFDPENQDNATSDYPFYGTVAAGVNLTF